MYEARKNKEKISRRIDANGGMARQRIRIKQISTTIQREWIKEQNCQNLFKWDKIENGLFWFYNENTKKMFYIIGEKSGISEEHIEWYKYFKGEEKTYQEWCRIFKGNLKIHAARDASMHTLGNYKARNAVISILTKNDLLNVYFKDGLEKIIQIIQDDKKILNDFKILYEKMTNQLIPSDVDVIDFFKEKFELSIPIIKGFKQLGTGDKDLVGKKVNRGDSENILDSMNLSDVKKKKNGEYKYNKRVKFPGVTSTSIGDDPAQNQYAKNSAVVWILTIGEKHHGFDFKKYVGEGYGSESEITFPMGVEVDIHLINIGKQENLKAKYVIQGTIY